MASRHRRTNRDILLDKITELSAKGEAFVPNKAVREALDWDHDHYWRVRQELIDEGRVVARRGKGGTVNLTDEPGAHTVSMFISYSHADMDFKPIVISNRVLERRRTLTGRIGATWNASARCTGAAFAAVSGC